MPLLRNWGINGINNLTSNLKTDFDLTITYIVEYGIQLGWHKCEPTTDWTICVSTLITPIIPRAKQHQCRPTPQVTTTTLKGVVVKLKMELSLKGHAFYQNGITCLQKKANVSVSTPTISWCHNHHHTICSENPILPFDFVCTVKICSTTFCSI